MWSGDLLPFGALADRLPMIMVAHAEYPALERSVSHSSGPDFRPLPASLSPHLVTGLLKGKMSYGGLVLCDDLEMGAVLEDRTLEEATVAAVRAGCDLLLVCRRAENVQRAFDALLRESGRNAGFRTLLEKAAQKILRAKQMLLASRKPAPLADCERLRQEILDFTDKVSRSLEPLSPQQG
jgi:beta-N-acetylhexosaminidase